MSTEARHSAPLPLAERAVAYQTEALGRVSRTFALTIPQLPQPLREVVGNAYLLCRIADTIEDEPTLPNPLKARLLGEFADVVASRTAAAGFAEAVLPRLSSATSAADKDLVAHIPLVLEITHRARPAQREAIERCVDIMTKGMGAFGGGCPHGLETRGDLERYTYCVAGVVGEMITDLACDYSAEIASRRSRLWPLSARFGHGLQMVNILKDVWEDQRRGTCWLPRDAFASGVDLSSPATSGDVRFADGLLALVGVARDHLEAAAQYTLLIPSRETGIRRFLLWALGLAVLTLRRIHADPRYASGAAVKVPRSHVRATVVLTSGAARWDSGLQWLFDTVAAPLPHAPGGQG